MITVAQNHNHAVHELSRRQIPFHEVTIHTADGPQQVIELSDTALIIMTASLLSDDVDMSKSQESVSCQN